MAHGRPSPLGFPSNYVSEGGSRDVKSYGTGGPRSPRGTKCNFDMGGKDIFINKLASILPTGFDTDS
jgi:hypothetical protein